MRYTINFDCKTAYIKKDDTIPMTLRISINGKHDYLNLGKRIKIEHYDLKNKWIKQGIKGYSSYTSYINREKVIVDNVFNEYNKRNEILTFGILKEEYNNHTGKVKTLNFYEFVDETIQYERKFTKITNDTLDYYLDQQRKVKLFRNKLSIHDINKKFLDDGTISKYPFANYVIGQPKQVDIDFLMPDELLMLHQLYENGELKKIIKKNEKKHTNHLKRDFPIGLTYQNVLRYYLASCYCGLRFSDIQRLKTTEHFKNGYIVIQVKKGRLGNRKTVRIPLRKRLLSLLDLRERGLVFEDPVMENSYTNKILKEIMKIAGINKKITFHTARHTFAVVSLLLGVKFEVVSDILGHSELTTTQRYAHIVDELRDKEMDKWDKFEEEPTLPSQEQVICPTCKNAVMTFEKGIINLNKIPVICQYCSTSFAYNLNSTLTDY